MNVSTASKHGPANVGKARLGFMLILFLTIPVLGQTPSLSVQEIIRRSAAATSADWEKAPAFDYCETNQDREMPKTYEVLMLEGSPYSRLVAVNGQALSASEEEREQQNLASVIQHRKSETVPEHQQRIAQYEKERQRDHLLLEQLTEAMEFSLAGSEDVGPYKTYVLEARSKVGYIAKSREAKVLTGMRGRLWIDESSFRWVKVEAEVVHPVMIDGFMARVEPGTRFEMEEMPVDQNLWLPNHFSMQVHARVLLLFAKSFRMDDTYSAYRANGSLSPLSCRQP